MYTHSYTEDSKIVHLGKCHSENLECGMCEAGFDELNKLEMHLNTCEKNITNLQRSGI